MKAGTKDFKGKPAVVSAPPSSVNYLVLIRHGQRLDDNHYVTNEEREATKVEHPLDIPLSVRGKEMAIETGQFLLKYLKERMNGQECDFLFYSSPYVRCLQTAAGVLNGLGLNKEIVVREELSEFQLGNNGDNLRIDDLVVNKYKTDDEKV